MFVSAGTDLKFYSCPVDETEYHYSAQVPSKITCLSWCRDNCYLVFLSAQSNPEILSLKTNQNIKKVHTITALKDVSSVAFQRTTKKSIGIGTGTGQIALYDTKHKGISKLFPSLNSFVTSVDFDVKDETMAVSCRGGSINILEVSNGKCLSTYKSVDSFVPNIVKYHMVANNLLASATEGGSVCIWDVKTSRKLFSAQIHTSAVGGLALGRQNDLFVTAGFDRKFCVHDLNIKECIFRGNLHQPLSAIDISTRDDCIVIGTEEGTIYIYDIRHLLQPLSNWKAHCTAINKIAFANEGTTELDNKIHSSKATVSNKNYKLFDTDKSISTVMTNSQNSGKHYPSIEEANDSKSRSSNLALLVKDVKTFVKDKADQINLQMWNQFENYKKLLSDEFKNLDSGIETKWNKYSNNLIGLLKHQDQKEELDLRQDVAGNNDENINVR